MICSKCGRELPGGSRFCFFCGEPVAQAQGTGAGNTGEESAAESVKSAEGESAAESVKSAENESTDEGSKTAGEEKTAEGNPAEGNPWDVTKESSDEMASKLYYDDGSQEQPKKKKKGKALGIVLGILAAIILLLGGAVGAVFLFAKDAADNFIHVHFDKPAQYYEYVMDKNYKEKLENIPGIYASAMQRQLDIFDSAYREDIRVKLGNRGKDFLKLAAGEKADVTWLDSFGYSYGADFQLKNGKVGLDVSASLNEVKLFSVFFTGDFMEGVIAAQVPELSEKYGKLNVGKYYDKNEFQELLGYYREYLDILPKEEFYQKMVERYYRIFLDKTKEMEIIKEKDSLDADELTEECIRLTLNMREEDVRNLYIAVNEELAQDEDIKELIIKFAEVSKKINASNRIKAMANKTEEEDENTPEKQYEKFQEQCRKRNSEEELAKIDIHKAKLSLYVNKRSEIIGIDFETEPKKEDGDAVDFHEAMLVNKEGKVGFTYRYGVGKKNFYFRGGGKVKEEKLDGDFLLDVNDENVMKLTVEGFDLAEAKKGNFNGHFLVKPGNDFDLVEKIRENYNVKEEDSPVLVFLSTLDLSVDIRESVNMEKHSIEIGILDGGLELVTFFFDGGLVETGSIAIPSDAIDIEKDSTVYLKTVKFDKLIEALKKAKVPKEYLESLEEWAEEYEEYLGYLDGAYRFY